MSVARGCYLLIFIGALMLLPAVARNAKDARPSALGGSDHVVFYWNPPQLSVLYGTTTHSTVSFGYGHGQYVVELEIFYDPSCPRKTLSLETGRSFVKNGLEHVRVNIMASPKVPLAHCYIQASLQNSATGRIVGYAYLPVMVRPTQEAR
jgi:hypothetical protein